MTLLVRNMAADQNTISTLALVLSSAVVSAAVTVAWNAIARYLDRRKENQRNDHIYLEIALQLETFARECNERIYDINEALGRYREHDQNAFSNIKGVSLRFNPEPEWTSLPVAFVAKVKGLQTRFNQSQAWLSAQFQLWAGLDDVHEFDEERLAFYALEACKIAVQTRKKIKAGSGETDSLNSHFEQVIDRRRTLYIANAERHTFIPELRAKFDSENSR